MIASALPPTILRRVIDFGLEPAREQVGSMPVDRWWRSRAETLVPADANQRRHIETDDAENGNRRGRGPSGDL